MFQTSLDYIYNRTNLFANLVPNTGLVLIGHATQGPSMTIVDTKNSIQRVQNIFGTDSTLTRAYIEAVQNGATNVYLVRINGTHQELWTDGVLLRSMEATNSSTYIDISDSTAETLIINNEETQESSSFTIDANLITNINIAASNGECEVYAQACAVEPTLSTGATEEYLYEINDRLTTILEILETYPIQQVGILCGSFNHKETGEETISMYSIVTDFVTSKTQAFEPCIVTLGILPELDHAYNYENPVMGIAPLDENGAYIYPYLYAQLVENAPIEGFDLSPVTDDKSMYINTIISRALYDNGYESYYSPCIGVYCGLIARSYYGSSTTNKTIPNIREDVTNYNYGIDSTSYSYYIYQELIDDRIDSLIDLGYVIIKKDRHTGLNVARVLAGINDAYAASPIIGKVSNVLLIQDITTEIAMYLQDFVNMPRREIETGIYDILDRFTTVIKDYTIVSKEILVGYAKKLQFDIELLIFGELQSIHLKVRTK